MCYSAPKPVKKLQKKVWHFFEDSITPAATTVRIIIIVLILLSAITALMEFFTSETLAPYIDFVHAAENIILIIFTVEFVLRFFGAPKKGSFITDKYTIIDLLAIVPFYFSLPNVAFVRILRVLRIARTLKFVRLFKQAKFSETFRFKHTVIEEVTPVALMIVALKGLIWILETGGFWFTNEKLGTLFTIVGFALGIVLSQKIGTAYKKYIDLQEKLFTLHGKISSFSFYLDALKQGTGKQFVSEWLGSFLGIYQGKEGRGEKVRKLVDINEQFYKNVLSLGNEPLIPHHRLAALMKEIFETAIYVVSKKDTPYSPGAYNRLIQQITLMYIGLLVIFIPGITGVVSVVVATYLLYGLFYVARDFEMLTVEEGSTVGSLITLEPTRLQHYLDKLITLSK